MPVKRFADAKARLAPALDARQRAELAQEMAENVVRACSPLPTTVVCDDMAVSEWAGSLGLQVIWAPGRGLNGAVAFGVESLGGQGVDRVLVVHADLASAAPGDLAALPAEGVVLVPDRHGDGTNVASVPSSSAFAWSYGPGSFERHRLEAIRLDLGLTVVRHERLGWDVDTPADLVGAP